MELYNLYERYLRDRKLDISREEIFLAIESTPSPRLRACFEHILSTRLQQITYQSPSCKYLNIAGQLHSAIYLEQICQNSNGLSPFEYQLEQLALAYFDSIADLWCEYEINHIKAKYQKQLNHFSEPIFNNNYDESAYSSQLIDNVESDLNHYYTLYFSAPLSLSDAILLSNLCTFIKQHKWYEMLFSLSLSTQGTHFILTTNSASGIPLLVSSARIQYWQHRDEWLYLSPFFQSRAWTPSIAPHFQQTLEAQHILRPHSHIDPSSISALDSSLTESIIDKQAICEILRLTASGNTLQCSFILYLAQKHMMALLYERALALGFVVIEQPLMMSYYDSLSDNEYLYTAECNLQDTGNSTYKGLWIIDKLNQQLKTTSYKEYKRRVFLQRKQSSAARLEGNRHG